MLRRAYKMSSARCDELLHGLLNARELRIGHGDVLRNALAGSGGEVNFADAVIVELGRVAGCDHTNTFDRRAARHKDVQLLGPEPPNSSSDTEVSNSTPAPSAE